MAVGRVHVGIQGGELKWGWRNNYPEKKLYSKYDVDTYRQREIIKRRKERRVNKWLGGRKEVNTKKIVYTTGTT